jgi:hypothetical protein
MATTPLKPETIPQKLIKINTGDKQNGTPAISRHSCHSIYKLRSVLCNVSDLDSSNPDPDPGICLNPDTDLGYYGKNVKNEQLKKKMVQSLQIKDA